MNSEQIKKTANLLTVCIKAGKTVLGFDAAVEAVKSKNAYCVLTAGDISEKTLKEAAFFCGKSGIPVIRTGISKSEMSVYTGRTTAVIAVCDKGFADGFKKIADAEK